MRFNNEGIDELEREVLAALRPVEEKLNVKIETGKIVYGDVSLSFELNVKRADVDADRFLWFQTCTRYGLEMEDYLAIVEIKDIEYRLVGFDTSKRKYPIIIEELRSKAKLAITVASIKKLLNKE